MKIILQDFEPKVAVAAKAAEPQVESPKSRVRLNPLNAELRLFHAL